MLFYVFAWIASLAYGLTGIITKLTGKYSISNPWLLNFLCIVFQLIITLPFALVNNVGTPSRWENIVPAAFTYAFFFVVYIISLYRLDISVFIPLFNFRSVFAVILGFIFLGETFFPLQILLISIIFIGGFFTSMDEKLKLSSFFKPEIGLAVSSMFILALNGFFINKAIAQNSYWQVTLWQYILAIIFLLPTVAKFKKEIRKISFGQLGAAFLIALSLLLGDLAANKAYADNLGISSTIISLPLSMVIAFVLSILAPKLLEKHTLKVYAIRFAAAAVMIISALKLTS